MSEGRLNMTKLRVKDLYAMVMWEELEIRVPKEVDLKREMTRVRSIMKRIGKHYTLKYSCKKMRDDRGFIVQRVQ